MEEFSFPNLWFIVPQTIPQQYLWLSSHQLAPSRPIIWPTIPRLYTSKMFILLDLHEFKGVRRGASKGKEKRASWARLHGFGCPPGIRTPIERVRVASPTIEREGNTGFYGSCRLGGSHNQPPL
jgi:hypothetical protein